MSIGGDNVTVAIAVVVAVFLVGQIYFFSAEARYNQNRFGGRGLLKALFVGGAPLKAGQPAPTSSLYSLREDRWVPAESLWSSRPIVVESGSITCPIFTGQCDAMHSLAQQYVDRADFYVLYTREAHPASNYPAHENFEQKMRHAADFDSLDSPNREILIDDIDGSFHLPLGGYPDGLAIIGTDGVIAFRADWNDPSDTAVELDELLKNGGTTAGYESFRDVPLGLATPGPEQASELKRVFVRAGWKAFVDMALSMPAMAASMLSRR